MMGRRGILGLAAGGAASLVAGKRSNRPGPPLHSPSYFGRGESALESASTGIGGLSDMAREAMHQAAREERDRHERRLRRLRRLGSISEAFAESFELEHQSIIARIWGRE